MSITIRDDYKNRKIIFTIEDAPRRVRKGARNALNEIGSENTRFCRRVIKKPPKTGRFYRFRGRRHQASSPGQPPANRSGDLMRSVHFRTYSWNRMEFGDGMPYGKHLEDGTKKMARRPHVLATVKQKRRDNYNTLEQGVYKAINRL